MSNAARRVLIVDDDHDYTDSLRMLLEIEGYEVQSAYDGASAVDLAREFRPQVVLLDLALPKMSGYDTAIALRRLEGGQKVKSPLRVVAISGYGRMKDREAAIAAGFDAHLVKPAEPSDVLQQLTGAL